MKFYTRELTPLRFHKLYHWVIMPINIIYIIYLLAEMFVSGKVSTLTVIYNGLLLLACAAAFIGCFKFRKYAWWAIMGGFVLEIFYSAYFIALYAVILPEQVMVAVNQVGWRFVAVIMMGVYYYKRRPLFFNPVPLEEIPEEYWKKK